MKTHKNHKTTLRGDIFTSSVLNNADLHRASADLHGASVDGKCTSVHGGEQSSPENRQASVKVYKRSRQ